MPPTLAHRRLAITSGRVLCKGFFGAKDVGDVYLLDTRIFRTTFTSGTTDRNTAVSLGVHSCECSSNNSEADTSSTYLRGWRRISIRQRVISLILLPLRDSVVVVVFTASHRPILIEKVWLEFSSAFWSISGICADLTCPVYSFIISAITMSRKFYILWMEIAKTGIPRRCFCCFLFRPEGEQTVAPTIVRYAILNPDPTTKSVLRMGLW